MSLRSSSREDQRDDVLKDIHWWGNFDEATEYKGNTVCAVTYGVPWRPPSDSGMAVLAVFVGDNFFEVCSMAAVGAGGYS